MDFGAHLPLIDFASNGYSLDSLLSFAGAAQDCGYAALGANDHMLFARPWLDGPTSLAAVLPRSGSMSLMTTVALPVIRGPIQTAKILGAIDVLSGGRLIAGVGPGSSAGDYRAVGLNFEERWKRIDDAVEAMRAVWRGASYDGIYYACEGVNLEPRPAREGGPPIWIGSWGSAAGLRRTARLADGWLASAYNTTPEDFAAAWQSLGRLLNEAGKDAATFPNALATMWTYVTEDAVRARRVVEDVLAKMLNRDPDDLFEKLLVGSPEACAKKLRRYIDAGVQRVLIWPILDPIRQLEIFKTRVEPLLAG